MKWEQNGKTGVSQIFDHNISFFFQIISIESPQRTNEKKPKTGELPDLLKRYFFVKQSSEKFF